MEPAHPRSAKKLIINIIYADINTVTRQQSKHELSMDFSILVHWEAKAMERVDLPIARLEPLTS